MNIQKLSHAYGNSYFGSGGCSGAVRFSANARAAGSSDNGFVAGVSAIAVIDEALPARVFASGSDCIGEGRDWSEAWEFSPGVGWLDAYLSNAPSELPEGGQGRRNAWLRAGTTESAAALGAWHAARDAAEQARLAENARLQSAHNAECAARNAARAAIADAEEAAAAVIRAWCVSHRPGKAVRHRAGGPGRAL